MPCRSCAIAPPRRHVQPFFSRLALSCTLYSSKGCLQLGFSANLRSPSVSIYLRDTESMSRTRTRTLGAGMENSAEFHGKYHLALGALRVSNIYRLLIQSIMAQHAQKLAPNARRNALWPSIETQRYVMPNRT